MEIGDIKKIIEALLFVSDKPLLNREIRAVVKDDLPEDIKIEDIMKEIQQEYVQLNRAFELKFVADGWTFATKPEYSNWIKKLLKEKTILKLSPSAMEVLAIIAYKQPITRAEIDNVRGVDSGGVIDTLTDRKFIKIVGRKETLGRPLLYGTTQEFLRHFGLSHLSELPVIEAAKDVLPQQQEEVQELPFDENKEETDNSGNETNNNETGNNDNKETETEQQNNNENVVNEENVLSNDIKDNSVDVVTENLNNEQNSTEN
jgi:segregation and condensation protein B